MSRSFFAVFFASQILVSSAMAAAPFLACATPNADTVKLEVSNPYNDSLVRVKIQERRAQGVVTSLNDLTNTQGHAQGVLANQMFRLEVSPYTAASGSHTGKITFFYDQSVRASYSLVCSTAR